MILRASLIAAHVGTVLGPALVLTALAPRGAGLLAFPHAIARGGPWVIAILVLATVQAVAGSLLALRNLRVVTPVGVHVIGPTFIAWVGLGGATLGVAAAGESVGLPSSAGILNPWARSLAIADLARQFGFLVAGWGWLAALASVTLGAFSRRGGAPRKPGLRVAIIAAACTLPTVMLLLGGDLVAPRSVIYLIAVALTAGGLLGLATPTVSVWSVSDDTVSRGQAFSTIWLCGCAAIVAVATQGLAMAWLAQSEALMAAVLAVSHTAVANAARTQTELSTALAYLAAGLALTWLTLAMRGRRVVFTAPIQNLGSVLVTLVLATSIGVANSLFEHGANRRHAEFLAMAEPVAESIELPVADVREPRRLTSVVRITADRMATGGTSLATREGDTWTWRGDAALAATTIAPAVPWQRQICGEANREIAVAAPGTGSATDLLGALAQLRRHGICRVELLARATAIPFDAATLSPWVQGVVEIKQREPRGISFFLGTAPPEGAVVVTVDPAGIDPAKPNPDLPIALRWRDDVTLTQALTLAPAPYAVLLLPED